MLRVAAERRDCSDPVGYIQGMNTFSLRRMFAAVSLIAAGCGAMAFVWNGSGPSGFTVIAAVSCLPLLGAGVFDLFKRPILGAVIGFVLFIAFVFYVLSHMHGGIC